MRAFELFNSQEEGKKKTEKALQVSVNSEGTNKCLAILFYFFLFISNSLLMNQLIDGLTLLH